MKGESVMTRIARGAVTSSMASAFLLPQTHAKLEASILPHQDFAVAEMTSTLRPACLEETGEIFHVVREVANEWTRGMEREFRRLALAEAKGTLTHEQASRLNELDHSRTCLLCPPNEEEMLRRIKRDRLLEKLSEALREYVEFEEGTSQKRATA